MNRNILLSLIACALFTTVLSQQVVEQQCCSGETWTYCPASCSGRCCPVDQIKMCGEKTRCMIKGEVQRDIADLENKVTALSCEFYDVLESLYQCGATGYPISFGKKYCQKFLDDFKNYDNQKWQNAVRKCLQEKITSEVKKTYSDQKAFSCANISDFAFNSHIDCYVQPDPQDPQTSYCNNTLTDNIKIMSAVIRGGAFFDAVKQAGPVACKCRNNDVKYENRFRNFISNAFICKIYETFKSDKKNLQASYFKNKSNEDSLKENNIIEENIKVNYSL